MTKDERRDIRNGILPPGWFIVGGPHGMFELIALPGRRLSFRDVIDWFKEPIPRKPGGGIHWRAWFNALAPADDIACWWGHCDDLVTRLQRRGHAASCMFVKRDGDRFERSGMCVVASVQRGSKCPKT